jgi:hypothetical protein
MAIITCEQVLLKITKIGYYFSKILPGGVSWTLCPIGKIFFGPGGDKRWTTLHYTIKAVGVVVKLRSSLILTSERDDKLTRNPDISHPMREDE